MYRIKNERHKVEKEEGKQYHEPGVSDTMKALNKKFGVAHGCSSIVNLAVLISLFIYPFVSSQALL